MIIAKYTEEDYAGYVLSSDNDIDAFLAYFNLSPNETNQLINIITKPNIKIEQLIEEFISHFQNFPETHFKHQSHSSVLSCLNG